MPSSRPTFHESWHRVANLTPRLRPSTRVVRQVHRGKVWHIFEDPSGSQFFRASESAYRFIGLLTGSITVDRAWTLVAQQLADDAPTQGEVIQILSQLSAANLLHTGAPGDAQALFERRSRRVAREARSTLLNLLFLRVPLFDPDPWLTRWTPLVAPLISRAGLALWLVLIAVGGWHLLGSRADLASSFEGAISAQNLIWLYVTFAFIKMLHELGHAFACKAIGRRASDPSGSAGAVHTVGVMFLFFMPVPYVDASSSWLFPRRRDRILVASAGIIVELALAAIAAIIWSRSAPGTLTHALAYNTILIAGVSTLILNGNPLMRYDGYFILSDLIQIPNLARRSTQHIAHLIKKHLWRLPRLPDPQSSPAERAWLFSYAVASFAYRIALYIALTLFVIDQRWVLGLLVLAMLALAWLAAPAAAIVRYLATSPEIERIRRRAVLTSLALAAFIVAALGIIPVPQHARIEGIVEPARFDNVYAQSTGVVLSRRPSGQPVAAGDELLAASSNELDAQLNIILAQQRALAAQRRLALDADPAQLAPIDTQLAALNDQESELRARQAALRVRASIDGVWIAPAADRVLGATMTRGEPLGVVADLSALVVRATAPQHVAARLIADARPDVQVRARNSPDQASTAALERIFPAGSQNLPSPALAQSAGGSTLTNPDARTGDAPSSAEPFFEVRLRLASTASLLPGQRVIARFRLPNRPLLSQWWNAAAQTFQARFRL